jgi:hypothetical protein
MSTPQHPMVAPDSLVHAQLAPDRRTVSPGNPARLTLVVDNHDRRSRAVQLQLGGAMSRFCRPRLSTIDVLPGEQREVVIEVSPQSTAPEGGHDYELDVTATDLGDGTFLDRSTARITVEPHPVLRGRPTSRERTVDTTPTTLNLVAHNGGNVELRVDVFSVDAHWWVPDGNGQRSRERARAVRAGINSIVSQPIATEHLRPGEHWNLAIPVVAPRYLIGVAPRRWLIPVAVAAQGWSPEAVFVELDQTPRMLVPYRAAVFAAIVVFTLVVLIAFMAWLAS